MIYIKEGTEKLEGSHAQLLTDLTCVIKELKDSLENDLSKENAEKMIREAVDVAFWDREKLEEETKNLKRRMLSVLLRDLFSDSGEKNE